jgi:hypothetical protein
MVKKVQRAAALAKAGIPTAGFSRTQFCARWDISPGFYLKMQREGIGPRETRLCERFVITVEDEQEWIRRRQEAAA